MRSASRPSLNTERAQAADPVIVIPATVLEEKRRERDRRRKPARTLLDDPESEEIGNGN